MPSTAKISPAAQPLLARAMAMQRAGQPEAAPPLIDQAIALQPRMAAFHDSRGQVLRALGRLEEAVQAGRHAVRLQPGAFHHHYHLGNALYGLGRFEEAAQCYRRAAQLKPDEAGPFNNLGNALRALQQWDRAAAAFRSAVQLQPGAAELRLNLGGVLLDGGMPAEAEAVFAELVRLHPQHPAGWAQLARARARQEDHAGALLAAEAALRLQPDDPALHNDAAQALMQLDRTEEAEAALRATLRLLPDSAGAWNNLGSLLCLLGRLDESAACLEEALRRDPGDAGMRYNRAILDLKAGRLAEGLRQFGTRWDALAMKRHMAGPVWGGEPLAGRTLLIHEEQGLGDFIQFCRFVPMAAERGPVILRVPRTLRRLVGTLAGQHSVVVPEDTPAMPPFDLHLPMLDLPMVLGTTLETIPSVPYLRADPALVAEWRERLAPLPGLRVGLAWAGNADYPQDRHRSIAGEALEALAGTPGVSFVSLQLGGAPWTRLPDRLRAALILCDPTPDLADFADTAALVAALDLVVCVDTSVAHLAGALGCPVWLLNRFTTDWRWLLERTDSPWYPSMRIIRQPRPGNWASVLAAVRAALAEHGPTTRSVCLAPASPASRAPRSSP